jgi:tRNA modification GTPase
MLDEAMVVRMKGPKTYTCEDVVEINCHGGYLNNTENTGA